jgi:hypothetical protein
MAYKYFTKQLIENLDKYNLDLSDVFIEKQQKSKEANNVAYGLPDIVFYLKDSTNDFKTSDSKFIDMDNAIRTIIQNYYKSIGERSPFETDEDMFKEELIDEGKAPKESFEVKDGETKVVTAPKGLTKKGETAVEKPKKETKAEKIKKIEAAVEVIKPQGGQNIDGVFVSDFAMNEYGKDQVEEWVEAVNAILEFTTEEDRTDEEKESLQIIMEYLSATK